jgi:hypothetical protein
MPEETKSPLLSKTLWLNFVLAICALFWPAAGQFVSSHPEITMVLVTGVNFVLRLVTKKPIEVS